MEKKISMKISSFIIIILRYVLDKKNWYIFEQLF